jgi:hypothetical protein
LLEKYKLQGSRMIAEVKKGYLSPNK